jgi:hypothetical protein
LSGLLYILLTGLLYGIIFLNFHFSVRRFLTASESQLDLDKTINYDEEVEDVQGQAVKTVITDQQQYDLVLQMKCLIFVDTPSRLL